MLTRKILFLGAIVALGTAGSLTLVDLNYQGKLSIQPIELSPGEGGSSCCSKKSHCCPSDSDYQDPPGHICPIPKGDEILADHVCPLSGSGESEGACCLSGSSDLANLPPCCQKDGVKETGMEPAPAPIVASEIPATDEAADADVKPAEESTATEETAATDAAN